MSKADIAWTVSYFGKSPTRLPESLWFSFIPSVSTREAASWRVSKLQLWVSPYDAAKNASNAIHGQWNGLALGNSATVSSAEVPLVVLGQPTPLVYLGDDALQPSDVAERGVHYCIFNNQYSTNYAVFLFDSEFRSTFRWKWGAKSALE